MAGREMRITSEADYAIRICIVLSTDGKKIGATEISDRAKISQQFALKILRKLVASDIVRSYKGVCGGYELAREPRSLTALDIIEAIDGKTYINKCLCCQSECSRNPRKSDCKMHIAFGVINKRLVDSLASITLEMLSSDSVSAQDIVSVIN